MVGRPRGTVLPTLRNNSSVSIVPRSSTGGRGAVRPVRVLSKQQGNALIFLYEIVRPNFLS